MSAPVYNVSIDGDSNDSNLVISSANGSINEAASSSNNLDLNELLLKIQKNESDIKVLSEAITQSQLVSSAPYTVNIVYLTEITFNENVYKISAMATSTSDISEEDAMHKATLMAKKKTESIGKITGNKLMPNAKNFNYPLFLDQTYALSLSTTDPSAVQMFTIDDVNWYMPSKLEGLTVFPIKNSPELLGNMVKDSKLTILNSLVNEVDFFNLLKESLVYSRDFITTNNGYKMYNLTLFAPTDEAFQQSGLVTLLEGLSGEVRKRTIVDTLKNHLVNASFDPLDFPTGTKIQTFGDILLDYSDSKLKVYGGNEISLLFTNIHATNGMMHVINNVILPLPEVSQSLNNTFELKVNQHAKINLNIAQEKQYEIKTSGANIHGDTQLFLYDSLGNLVAENDDINYTGKNIINRSNYSKIVKVLPVGSYYLVVKVLHNYETKIREAGENDAFQRFGSLVFETSQQSTFNLYDKLDITVTLNSENIVNNVETKKTFSGETTAINKGNYSIQDMPNAPILNGNEGDNYFAQSFVPGTSEGPLVGIGGSTQSGLVSYNYKTGESKFIENGFGLYNINKDDGFIDTDGYSLKFENTDGIRSYSKNSPHFGKFIATIEQVTPELDANGVLRDIAYSAVVRIDNSTKKEDTTFQRVILGKIIGGASLTRGMEIDEDTDEIYVTFGFFAQETFDIAHYLNQDTKWIEGSGYINFLRIKPNGGIDYTLPYIVLLNNSYFATGVYGSIGVTYKNSAIVKKNSEKYLFVTGVFNEAVVFDSFDTSTRKYSTGVKYGSARPGIDFTGVCTNAVTPVPNSVQSLGNVAKIKITAGSNVSLENWGLKYNNTSQMSGLFLDQSLIDDGSLTINSDDTLTGGKFFNYFGLRSVSAYKDNIAISWSATYNNTVLHKFNYGTASGSAIAEVNFETGLCTLIPQEDVYFYFPHLPGALTLPVKYGNYVGYPNADTYANALSSSGIAFLPVKNNTKLVAGGYGATYVGPDKDGILLTVGYEPIANTRFLLKYSRHFAPIIDTNKEYESQFLTEKDFKYKNYVENASKLNSNQFYRAGKLSFIDVDNYLYIINLTDSNGINKFSLFNNTIKFEKDTYDIQEEMGFTTKFNIDKETDKKTSLYSFNFDIGDYLNYKLFRKSLKPNCVLIETSPLSLKNLDKHLCDEFLTLFVSEEQNIIKRMVAEYNLLTKTMTILRSDITDLNGIIQDLFIAGDKYLSLNITGGWNNKILDKLDGETDEEFTARVLEKVPLEAKFKVYDKDLRLINEQPINLTKKYNYDIILTGGPGSLITGTGSLTIPREDGEVQVLDIFDENNIIFGYLNTTTTPGVVDVLVEILNLQTNVSTQKILTQDNTIITANFPSYIGFGQVATPYYTLDKNVLYNEFYANNTGIIRCNPIDANRKLIKYANSLFILNKNGDLTSLTIPLTHSLRECFLLDALVMKNGTKLVLMGTFETCLGNTANGLCVLNLNSDFTSVTFANEIPEFELNNSVYVNGFENLNKLDENKFVVQATNIKSGSPKLSQVITIN